MAVLGSLRLPLVGQALSGVIPTQLRDFHASRSFSACAFLFIAALLLGGGTRGGFLSDTILELVAIPVLLLSLSSLLNLSIWRRHPRPNIYRPLLFCCVIAALP